MCPPGVDQTTRSAQQWQILSPRLKRSTRLAPKGSFATGNPTDVIFTGYSWDAWSKLVVSPKRRQQPFSVTADSLRKKDHCPPSTLEMLPPEILAQIFSILYSHLDITEEFVEGEYDNYVVDKVAHRRRDVLSLGLTCTSLWFNCLRHVAYLRARVPNWAGTEVACLGTWLTQLPASLVEAGLAPKETLTDAIPPGMNRMCYARKWNWATWSYPRCEDVDQCTLWAKAFDEVVAAAEDNVEHAGEPKKNAEANRSPKVLDEKLKQMLRDATDPSAGFQPQDGTEGGWMLRNLSKKLFIWVVPPTEKSGAQVLPEVHLRSKKRKLRDLTPKQLMYDGRIVGQENLMLDDALLLRICWSPHRFSSRTEMESRGGWAGDRFDIVWDDGVLKNGWADVTRHMVKDMRLWKLRTSKKSLVSLTGSQ